MKTARLTLLTSLAVVTCLARPASAQDPAAVSAARALGQEGAIAARDGRCEEAVQKLSSAKKILSVVTILVPLGECQITLGQVVAGTENLQIAARERLADDAPKPFVEAQQRARKILPDALKKLAKINIAVEAPAGVKFTVHDNEDLVSDVLIGLDKPSDPGAHVIAVSAPGYLTAKAEVSVVSGQRGEVKLKLEPDPNAPKPVPEPDKTPPKPDQTTPPTTTTPLPEKGTSPLVIGGGVALGLGAAGIILGGVFGGLASSKKSDLDEVCSDNQLCPGSSEDDINTMNSFAHVSTAGFVVGGVSAALGAILLGVGLSQRTGPTSRAAVVRPLVGPGFVGLDGEF